MIQISTFKDIMSSKIGGKPVAKMANFYSTLYEAMLKVKSNVDLPSSIRTQQLTNPVYSDISKYVIPTDLGMQGIINLRPIIADDSFYDYSNFSQRQFVIENKFDTGEFVKRYAIRYQDGVPYLNFSGTGTAPVVISDCESLTSNGTWGVYGVASDIGADSLQVYAGTASLAFTVNAGGAQGIQNSTLASVDLNEKNDIFFAVYLPTTTGVTGVRMSLGQSTGAYYTGTATTDFFGNAIKTGWNLIKISKTSFTAGVGSPTWTGVVFARFEILGTFTTSTSGFRLDNLVSNVGVLMELDYYSDYSFASSSMAFKDFPTLDSDYIVMDGTELPLLINQFIEIASVDLKQAGAGVDYNAYGGKVLKDMYEDFRIQYPSQRQLMITKYSNRPRFDLPDTGLYGY